MCSACGFPPAVGHWTDAGGNTAHARLRIRFARAALLNNLLKPLGLKVRDLGSQPGVVLSTAMGRTIICKTVEDIWEQVELLTGKSFDPMTIIDAP